MCECYTNDEADSGVMEVGEGVQYFEDLVCWQVARELTDEIYTLTKEQSIRKDYGFADQIRRAAVSVMNNIAEGFERDTNKDFIKFLFIARASAGEVRSMLYVALDQKYLDKKSFQHLYRLCCRSSSLCWGLITSLGKKANWKTRLS